MAIACSRSRGGQVAVARRHGEAIDLTHGWHTDDFDRNVEVFGHAGDDLQLLVVLLAEHGEIGTGLDEELGDDGGDAIEELRAEPVLKAGLGGTCQ